MAKVYYTLVSREKAPGSKWCIEFGDYDRKVVVQEKEDSKLPKTEYQIIKSLDSQMAVNDAVNALNNKF